MEAIFFILRVPIYLIGLILCIIILPFDYVILAIEYCSHIFIAVFRTLGAPFVIIGSAWFDRSSWPNYVKEWQKAHESVDPDWKRPLKRFSELSTWLTDGPQ